MAFLAVTSSLMDFNLSALSLFKSRKQTIPIARQRAGSKVPIIFKPFKVSGDISVFATNPILIRPKPNKAPEIRLANLGAWRPWRP